MIYPKDRWTYRFHRDEKAWVREPRVFVDMGRPMPNGSPALLKTRQHLLREQAEGMWKDLVRKGWKQVPAVCGAVAEHRSKKYQSVLLGKGIRPLCKCLIPYPINSDGPEQEPWIT